MDWPNDCVSIGSKPRGDEWNLRVVRIVILVGVGLVFGSYRMFYREEIVNLWLFFRRIFPFFFGYLGFVFQIRDLVEGRY